MPNTGSRRFVVGANPRRTAVRASVLIVVAFVVFGYVLLPVRGVGVSMEPTIEPGDLIFINRLGYRLREPRRGDIVAVRIAGSAVLVKRLLGLPGDQIHITDGTMRINGEILEEPYVKNRAAWNLGPVRLGFDEYFVVGDNRGMSMELHEMGTATRARLIGPRLF